MTYMESGEEAGALAVIGRAVLDHYVGPSLASNPFGIRDVADHKEGEFTAELDVLTGVRINGTLTLWLPLRGSPATVWSPTMTSVDSPYPRLDTNFYKCRSQPWRIVTV